MQKSSWLYHNPARYLVLSSIRIRKAEKEYAEKGKAKVELKLPEGRHARDIDQRMTRECCGYDDSHDSPPSLPATIFHDRIF